MQADKGSREGSKPWHFRLAKFLIHNKYPGGYRLLGIADSLGLLNTIVTYDIAGEIRMNVPLYRRCNRWDETDISNYESSLVADLTDAISRIPHSTTFIDCGADIGLISVMMVASCTNIGRLLAFEPNNAAYEVLRVNVDRLPVSSEARCVGVADFTGLGDLVSPMHDSGDHAMYVAQSPLGHFPVVRIDDLDIDCHGGLAIKIDVEGGEMEVVQGASLSILRAKAIVVAFEAHPKQIARSSVDPVEIMRLLRSIRPCRFHVSERPEVNLSLDISFFDQIKPASICNIVCVSNE